MKKVPVVAVLVDAKGNACGFSRALTPKQLGGTEPIEIACFEVVRLLTARLEFAVPGGVIKTAEVLVGDKFAFPGYTVVCNVKENI